MNNRLNTNLLVKNSLSEEFSPVLETSRSGDSMSSDLEDVDSSAPGLMDP